MTISVKAHLCRTFTPGGGENVSEKEDEEEGFHQWHSPLFANTQSVIPCFWQCKFRVEVSFTVEVALDGT